MDTETPRRGGTATPSDTLHPQEKRELKRVFVMLCDYHGKQKCVGPRIPRSPFVKSNISTLTLNISIYHPDQVEI